MAFPQLEQHVESPGASQVVGPHREQDPAREVDHSLRGTLPFQTVHVVLPAFNEADALSPLLQEIRATLEANEVRYSVLVVDDGSEDETARVAAEASLQMPVNMAQHATNRGLAAALRTGLTMAVREAGPKDVIVTLDADNTHPPRLIPEMLNELAKGLDVVIASRFRAGAQVTGVPANRSLLSWGARCLFQMAFPIEGVRDYTCGYRAYRASALRIALDHYQEQLITEEGFSCMAEVLLNLRRCRMRMGEVPLELRYDRRGDASKMNVTSTVGQTLSLILRRKLRDV